MDVAPLRLALVAAGLCVASRRAEPPHPAPEGRPLLDVPGVGRLRGRAAQSGVALYAGVRYAEPPLGGLRWRPPRPRSASAGVVDAGAFAQACAQWLDGEAFGGEDCLALNVWAPAQRGAGLPVLVFLHGGSFVKGTADVNASATWGPLYDGASLAARGSVVVTAQYRLGALGFLASEAMRSRDPRNSTGNYGLQDQRLALQWVQRHIGAFGGDPQRVLLFGQSAGGASVMMHLVSKASRGLFSAAAVQSGYWGATLWADAESAYQALLVRTGCDDLSCLLRLPSSALVGPSDWSSPVVDGVELEDLPERLAERGALSNVPVVVGFNRDECSPTEVQEVHNETDFDMVVERAGIPADVRPVLKAEYSSQHTLWFWAASRLRSDWGMGCAAWQFAQYASAAGLPVFAYKFSRQPSFPVDRMVPGATAASRALYGAYHGAELPYVFGSPRIEAWHADQLPAERDLSEAIGGRWLELARRGVPGAGWPALNASGAAPRAWLALDAAGVALEEARVLPDCSRAAASLARLLLPSALAARGAAPREERRAAPPAPAPGALAPVQRRSAAGRRVA